MPDYKLSATLGEQLTWDNSDPSGDDRKWRATQFSTLPSLFHFAVAKQYNHLFATKGRYEANTFLRTLVKQFSQINFKLATDNDFLRKFAANRAKEFTRAIRSTPDPKDQYDTLSRLLINFDVTAPEVKPPVTVNGAVKRMLDESWLARRLRQANLPQFEAVAIKAGLVHKFASLYISEESLKAFKQRQSNNRQVMERMQLENEIGQVYELADLVALSVANPKNRRHELMARLYGFDQIAQRMGHVGLFITLTCPSRMHARYAKSGDPVPSYDGTTPRQAQHYLCNVWARARALFKHASIHVYGFRMAEPQHDGTPHWHILLYTAPHNEYEVGDILTRMALEDSPDEKGARKRRCDIKRIDWSKGSGVAYAAKYIAKNIDGEHIEQDLHGNQAKDTASRVVAWASTHRIRQFQQFGGPPVTCWRELRRIGSAPEGILNSARTAADQGDWSTFTNVLGGTDICRKDQPVKLVREHKSDLGRYGEPKGNQIAGVSDGYTCIQTRMHTWTAKLKSKSLRVLDEVRHP
ncbi:MAG: replication protein A [Gammaproteobacteria bacterium]|nr:replication protein A [Gammaproteobacteria bacterium]